MAIRTENSAEQQKAVPKAHGRRALLARLLLGVGLIAGMAFGGAWLLDKSIDADEERASVMGTARHELLGDVKRWGYQLQGLDIRTASQSPFDLLVIDEEFAGHHRGMPRTEMQRALTSLKRKPDGKRRLVLAYLSIGEAEDYRPYWDRSWVTVALPKTAEANSKTADRSMPGSLVQSSSIPALSGKAQVRPPFEPSAAAPAWLGPENSEWRGNYHVRFWDPAWQALLHGSEQAALDRIIAAGFDGVYFDRADAYMTWSQERPSARQEMASLIMRLSERARALSPGFIVMMQNAEELLGQNRVRQALDAVAKEDLLFGIDGAEKPNSSAEIEASLRLLKKAQGGGLPVLVIEYLEDRQLEIAARSRLDEHGFIPYFAPRQLDRLRIDQ